MFSTILIANRGEIACRILSTCRRLGVRTVAVYSEADVHARHVRLADEAYPIGGAAAADSYLRTERILAVAAATGAEAIHPGYGFLSERADFARACETAGIAFIGPRADTIELMGSKSASKKTVEAAGVPTVPGYHGDDQSDAALTSAAGKIGYPLLIKASAGGGGKGMRIVRKDAELKDAIVSARREARSAFGDDQLLLERFLEEPRHIEFQVFGDQHGNTIHLHERECSIQRRYQKIIEETPSPFLDDALRHRMAEAAVAAARAVNYCNAGTVEFIVSAEREFYFMEMNTRLQVEHPVTELLTGLDLVEWQLLIASGEKLPLKQADIRRNGAAIEARIYAERPQQDFLPSTGRITAFYHPPPDQSLRIDSGVDAGDEVSIHYDPMIAKLIVHGKDRATALRYLQQALARTAVFGPDTNLDLLRRIATHPLFAAGEIDTTYIDRHLAELVAPAASVPPQAAIAAAVAILHERTRPGANGAEGTSPWSTLDGWQANGRGVTRLRLAAPGGQPAALLAIRDDNCALSVNLDGHDHAVAVHEISPEQAVLSIDGQRAVVQIRRQGDARLLTHQATAIVLSNCPLYPVAAAEVDEQSHPGAPMPGRIVAIHVGEGQQVAAGDPLLVLEGMKMEFTVRARAAGSIERLLCAVGDQVEAEVPLVDLHTDDGEPAA